MKKGLPIGIESFEEIRESNGYYVDKTDILEELISNISKVKLFPRPRRFGKSILLSMIDCFFNIEKKSKVEDLFDGLKVNNSPIAINERSKYPVVMFNLKGIKTTNFEDTLVELKLRLSSLYLQYDFLKPILKDDELKEYMNIESKVANETEVKWALQKLTMYLERYYKTKVIVLIDEYDAPIYNAFHNGYYDELINVFKSIYTNLLKGNDSLKFASMTGVLRVSNESMFSDLNHVDVYSIMDRQFSEYFGFSEEEVISMLKYYELDEEIEEVKRWYNGYNFGGKKIYNPWSILNYVNKQTFDSYWVNSGENVLLKDLIKSSKVSIKADVLKLLNNEEVVTRLEDKISYKDFMYVKTNIFSILVLTGYLTIVKDYMEDSTKYYIIKIPNKEVKIEFKKILNNWIEKEEIDDDLNIFKNALLNGDELKMEEVLNKILETLSYFDTQEKFYHGFILGLLVTLGDKYILRSNKESGYGRYDLSIEAKDKSVGAVFEFKIAKSIEELDVKAIEALNQINEKRYSLELEERDIKTIYKYGVSLYSKMSKVIKD